MPRIWNLSGKLYAVSFEAGQSGGGMDIHGDLRSGY